MTNDTLIICEGEKFIHVHSQDGTPKRVTNAWDARRWQSLEQAQKYRDRFPEENEFWIIKVFRATALWTVDPKERS